MKCKKRLALLILMGGYGLWLQANGRDIMSSSARNEASAPDSLRVIQEVTVKSQIRYHETIEPQTLRGEALESVNAHTVADALRFMSGVQMKDYGGIGGLKTVNLRSMGSQHVGIYYDGIELGNAQNGVIDLGQLSLDNVEEVSVYQGQRSAILQTASDFANAGSVYIRTKHGDNVRHKFKLQTGSCGLLRMSGLMGWQLNDRIRMNVNVEGLVSNGRYKFEYRRRNYDGTMAYDTTATRQNGDVQSLRGEWNVYGKTTGGFWEGKLYTYHSNRGIPGAIVNNVWRRGERQSDDNTFAQGVWQRDYSERYTLRLMGKYANYRTHYLNKDSTQLMVDNTYRQQEAYFSATQVMEILPCWSLSASYDGRWNYLSSDMNLFVFPTRWTNMGAVATALDLGKVQMQGSLVYCGIKDHTDLSSNHWRAWTPAFFVSWKVCHSLTMSGFAKRSFRMPTFNDLYYTEMGNALLRPECALQYDFGVKYLPTWGNTKIEAHLYHNSVHDKIVAYPKGQQFRWTMLNLGKVHIDGVDINAETGWSLSRTMQLSVRAQYTFQRARDLTDRTTSYYGDQIPYTPWHSGSATAMLSWKGWNLAYNFVYTGERYCQQENIEYNHLQPWYTSDALLSWSHRRWKATIEINNLWDQQYDVVINYPMPGRNFNLTLQCEF